MRVIVAGPSEPAEALTGELSQLGAEARAVGLDGSADNRSVGGLAGALIAVEEAVAALAPDVVVALGSGDAATAAALVAGKAGVHLVSVAVAPTDGEARASGLLSAERFDPPRDDAGTEMLARRITA